MQKLFDQFSTIKFHPKFSDCSTLDVNIFWFLHSRMTANQNFFEVVAVGNTDRHLTTIFLAFYRPSN